MDIDRYIQLIKGIFPELEIHTIQPNTRGWANFVLEINGEWIFRFPRREEIVAATEMEIRLLPALAPALSTPIPQFEYIGWGNDAYPYPFVGYRKLDGMAFEDKGITPDQLAKLAPALATFLTELHSFPLAQAAQTKIPIFTPDQWRERYQNRYIYLQPRVFPLLTTNLREKSAQLWENFLNNHSLFGFQSALTHCDLSGEHILFDPQLGTLTGIIDWEDAMVGDPTLDFVGLHHARGRDFVERVLDHYQQPIDAAFWQRMDFYLNYGPYSQLVHGVDEGDEQLIKQGIEGLEALFGKS